MNSRTLHTHTDQDPTDTATQSTAATLQANLAHILHENQQLANNLPLLKAAALIPILQQAPRIFVIGAGRSGLAMKAAAMRLMHLGCTTFVVGETTTPAIRSGDLLLAASGSGTTSTIVNAAKKAAAAGATIITLTTTSQSPLANLSTHVLIIPAAQKQDFHGTLSQQYAGSLFEQFLLLFMDAVFQTLWAQDGTPAEELWTRHANLE